jgi:hypothetical protein
MIAISILVRHLKMHTCRLKMMPCRLQMRLPCH